MVLVGLLAAVVGGAAGCGRTGMNVLHVTGGGGGHISGSGGETASGGTFSYGGGGGGSTLGAGGSTALVPLDAGAASHCHPNPCQNGGECTDRAGDFQCRCPTARTGKTCSLLRFEGLGTRSDCDADYYPSPTDLSDDGLVVVGTCTSLVSFRWTAETGYQNVGFSGTAAGTNRDGSLIVGTYGEQNGDPGAAVLFDWKTATKVLLPAAGASSASAISSDGRVVVGTIQSDTGLAQPCRWIGRGQPDFLTLLPGVLRASADGVSSDGSVVVGWCDLGNYQGHAYRYSADGRSMMDLGVAPGTGYSSGFAVSGDGAVAVGESFDPSYPGIERAFRWTSATGMVDLGYPSTFIGAIAIDTNADGSVVAVQAYNLTSVQPFDRAMIWDARNGLRFVSQILTAASVSLDGWILRSVVAISADGSVVVGRGTNPAGNTEPWIARLDRLP